MHLNGDQIIRSQGAGKVLLSTKTSRLQAIHAKRLRLILALLDQAKSVEDMAAPALRLHQLKGELEGLWAVTVQANWRVTFRFENGDAHIVNYRDYH